MVIKDKSRLDDHFSRKARNEGFPARSVYKLEEIDQKHKLIRPGQKILDLGCAPGSWSLYAAQKTGPKGTVIGIDLEMPSTSFPANIKIFQADMLENPIKLVSDEAPFNIILSDMAPKTMGRRDVDQARSLELCQMAWVWAEKMLIKNGVFVFKIFQCQDGDDFIKNELQPRFEKIIRLKPKATRSQSLEIFVIGRKFKGSA